MTLKDEEPIRLSGYPAMIVGLVLLGALGWSQGLDVQQIVGQLAVVAITSIGGLEFARLRVDSPERVARKLERTRMATYQQAVHETRELDNANNEADEMGGIAFDLLSGLAAIGMVLLLAALTIHQAFGILVGALRMLVG